MENAKGTGRKIGSSPNPVVHKKTAKSRGSLLTTGKKAKGEGFGNVIEFLRRKNLKKKRPSRLPSKKKRNGGVNRRLPCKHTFKEENQHQPPKKHTPPALLKSLRKKRNLETNQRCSHSKKKTY